MPKPAPPSQAPGAAGTAIVLAFSGGLADIRFRFKGMESPAEPSGLPGLMTPVAEGFGGGSFWEAPPPAGLFVGRAGAMKENVEQAGNPAGAGKVKAQVQSRAAIRDRHAGEPVGGAEG